MVSPFFVLFVLKGKDNLKVGVVASKKIGKSVLRNKAKRRLREIVRLSQHNIPKNIWLVLVARHGILTVNFERAKNLFVALVNDAVKKNQ